MKDPVAARVLQQRRDVGRSAWVLLLGLVASSVPGQTVEVGTFGQQVAASFGEAQGLPSSDVLAVEVDRQGRVWAATVHGLAVHTGGDGFEPVPGHPGPLVHLTAVGDGVAAVSADLKRVLQIDGAGQANVLLQVRGAEQIRALTAGGYARGRELITPSPQTVVAVTDRVLYRNRNGGLEISPLPAPGDVLDVAAFPGGCPLALAAAEGLYLRPCGEEPWRRLVPRDGRRSWAPREVRVAAFGPDGELWFASPQGLGRRTPEGRWHLYTGADGLPYADFVAAAAATTPGGGIWLGTTLGAVHFEPGFFGDPLGPLRQTSDLRRPTSDLWEYRQGRRWLPADAVRDVAVSPDGDVWLATGAGVGRIAERRVTLAEKARFFEAEIDRYHRRTPYEYVSSVRLERAGDKSSFEQRSSDNDGLWTGMYGAGECFGYAATGRPELKQKARRAFRALAFLSEVTQGGAHPAPPGFIARSILPAAGPDPNQGLAARDRRRRGEHDRLWKILSPRWPLSADGRWYWKTDASSDELDGHFFLYAQYHDLVAETEEERREVRRVVTLIVDHLLAHDYSLVDHDGRHTRWAVFGPRELNHDPDWWGERGLNSLSLLSYLRVAAHVSGDPRYDAAARRLIEEHAYAANVRVPKIHTGPGTGNQSDDEMAFMSFYNLLRYESDPGLREIWAHAFWRYWLMERPERNPLFAFLYAGSGAAEKTYDGVFGDVALDPGPDWLDDSVESLKRYPLDRVSWGLRNSHRLDVVFLDGETERGARRDGKVLPIDERFVEHWNHDPWRLDHPGDGSALADGASFLLPYYLGLHHGFLSE